MAEEAQNFYELKPKPKSHSVNVSRPSSRIESQLNVSQRYKLNQNSTLWNQSVNTWRNTSENYSFPKGDRFNIFDRRKRKVQSPEVLPDFKSIPSTISSRYCTLGKGDKEYISKERLKQAMLFPSPGYTQVVVKPPRVQNISLGTSMRFVHKSLHNSPPVGSYNIFSQSKPRITIKRKLEDTSLNAIKSMPAPNHYVLNESSTKVQKFSNISFGKGQKMDFAKHDRDIPPVGNTSLLTKYDLVV